MKVEDHSSSPSNDEMLNQPQDPLERRRLQNRLSQRNHRRKIRERIAKLQERVIANELRAAAVLHGWDQGYNTAYNTSTFPTRPYSGFNEQHLGFTSRDISPISPEQNATFIPHFAPHSTQSWPTDPNAFQPPQIYTGDISHFPGIGTPTSVTPSTTISSSSNHVMSTATSPPNIGFAGDAFHEPEIAGDCRLPEHLPQSVTQPSYYVVTEAALPQVLQVINTMSPQSKVIVLVPPESSNSISAAIPIMPPSSPCYGESFRMAGEDSTTLHTSQNLSCLCYPHSAQIGSPAEPSPRARIGPGVYATCPLHKVAPSNFSTGGHPTRIL
ncbi:unnamed protein product [Penicillium salamii]|nr:unnamed protein product [Penicillium salamii]CAG8324611.1 unnamed protein product [Penicillium salamii]